ncbi:hypothetical protein [Thermaurantiacus sp.]
MPIQPDAEPVLEDFRVGPVEARTGELLRAAGAFARHRFEVALALGCALEDEGRGGEGAEA